MIKVKYQYLLKKIKRARKKSDQILFQKEIAYKKDKGLKYKSGYIKQKIKKKKKIILFKIIS